MEPLTIRRSTSTDLAFIELVSLLDADLKIRDGADHNFYNQYNAIATIKNCIVGYYNNMPVACGAIKKYDDTTMEVKRMYVLPEYRGKGFALKVISALEHWSKELGYSKCVLETGLMQPEAISLYRKCGYNRIPNYGQYDGVENSVCFEKIL